MHFNSKCLIASLIALTLVACGGGGGGGGGSTQTGVFRGPIVSGLQFETPTHEGLTDALGRFQFEPGESVTFRLGSTRLGTATASHQMSPIDMVPGVQVPVAMSRASYQLERAWEERTPFGRVCNTTVLLQTLDADSDVANGIQIPLAVLTLMEDVELDLADSNGRFEASVLFRQLLVDGVAQGLWGGAGRVTCSLPLALHTLYEDLNISTSFWRATHLAADTDGDGTHNYAYSREYNTHGFLVNERFDLDGDGAYDTMEVMAIDEQGNVLELSHDDGLDGVDTRYEWIYDNYGRTTAWSQDDGDDGSIDAEWTRFLTALGYLTESESDHNGDGSVDDRTYYTLNALGLTTLREVDEGDNGVVNERTVHSYNAQGLLSVTRSDNDADGAWDYIRLTIYDASERRSVSRNDNDGDGMWDVVRSVFYDEQGNVVESTQDHGDDGVVNVRTITTYNAQGDWITRSRDTNGDGVIDSSRTRALNAQGEPLIEQYDSNNDGSIDETKAYIYDEQGRRIRDELDEDGDGLIDRSTEYVVETGTWANVLGR